MTEPIAHMLTQIHNRVKYIGLPILTTMFLMSCQKERNERSISIDYEVIITNPSKHILNDGSLEVRFSDSESELAVKWSKDNYIGYIEISQEYTAQELQSGMYLLEIFVDPDMTIIDTVFLASYDTIAPGDYFPIYPGSYWIYDNSDTIKSFKEYNLIGLGHKYTGLSQTHGDPPNDPSFPVDSIYIPSVHVSSVDADYNFYFYSIPFDKRLNLTRYLPIVSEENEFHIKQWEDERYDYDYNSITILNVDTSLYINNTLFEDVVIAEHFNMPNLIGDISSNYSYVTKKLYFAKDIGLIKSEIFIPYTIEDDLFYDTTTINLVEYFISTL
jgi:hypothetical protein